MMIDFLKFLTIGMVVLLLWITFVLGVINKSAIIGDIASIEQFRSDFKKVNDKTLFGDAILINRRIASNQSMNRDWYFDLIVPDEWDDIKFIQIGK